MRQRVFDLVLLYGIGLLGVVMRRFDFPTAPVIVGMIQGPLAEAQLRNAISIGEGSPLVFLKRPMSLVLLLPRIGKFLAARKSKGAAAPTESHARLKMHRSHQRIGVCALPACV